MVVTAPKIQEEVHQCRWLDCTTIFENAEALYEHITTAHIGRKSAGTLSLECKWAGCSSKASKRDHLTSHARVHINLKPHTCSICTKAFKRPQDLKKHEKIHTEEHHTQHKHSKAVTVNVPTMGVAAQNGLFDEKQQQAAMMAGYPGAFLQPNFNFGFPMFPGHPGQAGLDLAQVIAQQQQLNAQVQAGYPISALQMQGMPGMPGFGMGYPGGANFPGGPQAQAQAQAAQAHAMQVFAAQSGMFPYGAANPYAYHPSQQPLQMPQQQQQQQHQPQQQALRPPNSAPAHSPAPVAATPTTASLYPNVSAMYGLYSPPTTSTITTSPATAAVKVEDIPSPAASAHSHTSARSAAHSHHSSSVSPRVPALSPPSLSSPENTYSPPSEHETEAFRRSFSGNAVAGKKRAFEETAGQFLGDMKNKRFQEEDAVAQLDAMSNFLFSPELTAPPLTPARSQDDSSGSSIASDYSNADVNTINDLLLSLGQTIEGSTPNVDFHPLDMNSCQPQQQQFNHPALPAYSGSMYPTLPTMDRNVTPTFAAPRASQTHSIYHGGNDFGAMASVRLSKPVAAPSIANDHKLPTYTTVGRLSRAAPMSDYRGMEVDDEEENDSRYTSSIRSTSLDVKSAPSAQEIAATKLAPILAASRVGAEKLRLPSIASITAPAAPSSSAGPGITLPSIRDMLERHSDSTSPGPISSPMSDSSSTTSASSARTIYPSFPTSSRSTNTPEPVRPQSSGGTVERLTHRVHKLDMRHHEASAGDSAPTSVIAAEDLSESDEDENDDHPSHSKKSRVESPEPMLVEVEEPQQRSEQKAAALKAHEELKQRRLFILKSLIVMVNANYRANLAAEAASKQPQPQAAEVEIKVEESQPQAIAA